MKIICFSTSCLLVTILIIRASVAMKELRKSRKIIINTDAGSDDALAIILALKYEAAHKGNIEIIAITCTYGNTEEEKVENNVLKTLTIMKKNNIPVYEGAENALLRDFNGSKVFGNDGFGDFQFTEKITVEIDRSKHAALALIDLVKLHSGEVSIISLGPLKNLALAIKLDSSFMKHVDELVIMGSSVSGIGNESPDVEFNFAADPESNFIEWRKNVFGKINFSSVDFLNKAETISSSVLPHWTEVDAVAVAIAIWPGMIIHFLITNVTPVYDGAARGSVLVDYRNHIGKPKNAKIIQEYDLELFKAKLLQYFSDL